MILRRGLFSLACLALAAGLLPHAVEATTIPRGNLVVTVGDTPDPAATGGQVTYGISVKNDGRLRAFNVVVTAPLPSGTSFVKCSVSPKLKTRTCTSSGGTVTAILGTMGAHAVFSVSLILTMPMVSSPTLVTLNVHANGDNVNDGNGSQTTTVVPTGISVTYLPSGRQATVSCGDTLSSSTFGTDTTVQFNESMSCNSSPVGITVTAAGKTVNLNRFKIVGATTAANIGNVGINVLNASNVTITAGSTGGTTGIEYFDYGVKESGSPGLTVNLLRVFRGRSAGIKTVSDNITLSNLLIDKTVGGTTNTAELPGGVGLHVSGNTHIATSIVRRTALIGILADGDSTHVGGNGRVTTIDGNTSTMQVQMSNGVGVQFENGPHTLKDTLVSGDTISGTSTDGVVIGASGTGNVLDGVAIKTHGGNGVVINGMNTQVSRCSVDNTVGLDAYVSAGSGTVFNGNDAQALGNGYVVSGASNTLTSNNAENTGDGFVVSGDGASLSSNTAVGTGGRGFVIDANGGSYNTNTAESSGGDGFVVNGDSNGFTGNQSKQNQGAGFNVPGTLNTFTSNSAQLDIGAEWIIGSGNIDNGGNKVNGATFSFTSSGGTFD